MGFGGYKKGRNLILNFFFSVPSTHHFMVFFFFPPNLKEQRPFLLDDFINFFFSFLIPNFIGKQKWIINPSGVYRTCVQFKLKELIF
jgi:hypothetical protein